MRPRRCCAIWERGSRRRWRTSHQRPETATDLPRTFWGRRSAGVNSRLAKTNGHNPNSVAAGPTIYLPPRRQHAGMVLLSRAENLEIIAANAAVSRLAGGYSHGGGQPVGSG